MTRCRPPGPPIPSSKLSEHFVPSPPRRSPWLRRGRRFGPRCCLVPATAILGVGPILFSQARGVVMGIFTRAMLGMAAGLTLMSCMKMAGHWFSTRYLGVATASVIALSAVGDSLTGRPLAMAAESFGWPMTFTGVGVIGLIWTVLVFAIVRDRPKGLKPGQRPYDPPPAPPKPTPSFVRTAAVILKIPAFWPLGFMYAGTDMIYWLYLLCFLSPVGAQLTAMILAQGSELIPEHISGSAMGFWSLFPVIGGVVIQKLVGRTLTVDPGPEFHPGARELYGYAFTPMLVYMFITVFLAIWLVRFQKTHKKKERISDCAVAT